MTAELENIIGLDRDQIINLRDTILQSGYIKEDRPRTSRILDKFFEKTIKAKVKEERYVSLDEILAVYSNADSCDENTARTQITAIMKQQLPQFFITVGRRLPYKAVILKAPDKRRAWYLEFAKNDPGIGDCVRGFWQQYCEGKSESLLLLNSSLFFRDTNGNFVRNLLCNDPASRAPLYEFLGEAIEEMEPIYSHVGAGQVAAGFLFAELFYERRIRLKYEPGVRLTDHMKSHNLIVVGNARTNPVFVAIQEHGNYRYRVVDSYVLDGGKRLEERIQIGPHEVVYRSVLTRCPNFDDDHVITTVCSNQGTSSVGVAGFLSRQTDLIKIYEGFGLNSAFCKLPERFQILFNVTVRKEPTETVLRTSIENVHVCESSDLIVLDRKPTTKRKPSVKVDVSLRKAKPIKLIKLTSAN